MSTPSNRSVSGFRELQVVSAAISPHAGKAIDSCRSMLRLYPEISHYTIIVDRPDDTVWAPLAGEAKVAVVDESTVYPKAEWQARYRGLEGLSPGRFGWYYQQILKLAWINSAAVRLSHAPQTDDVGLVIWDSDTRILRPLSFVDHRTGLTFSFFTKNPRERHRPFYVINAHLTGTPVDACQTWSNIVQFAALSATEARSFPTFLGLEPSDPRYADQLAAKIVSACTGAGLANAALFSEYELIGLFKKLRRDSPLRLARFIRTNNRVPSARQLNLMRHGRIDHFTLEERFDRTVPMSNTYLLAQIALQNAPILEKLRRFGS